MSGATAALRKACFEALEADAGLTTLIGNGHVFDRVPERVSVPYVVIGRTTVSDWSTATEDGETIVLFVHAWSMGRDRSEIDATAERVRAVLTAGLSLPDHDLIAIRFQLAETRRDGDSRMLHAVLRFAATIEPKTQI